MTDQFSAADAGETHTRVFYRIVRENPPTEGDFLSAVALGKPLPASAWLAFAAILARVHDLLAAVLATNQDYLSLSNEVFRADGGRFIRNLAAPAVHDANFIDAVTASSPQDIDALLARAAREYAHCRHLRFDVDPRTPPEFEARLRLEPAWSCTEVLLLVLEGELRVHPRPFDVRRIVDAAGWEAFTALHALDWLATAQAGVEVGAAIASCLRRKSPPIRFWLGYVDGVARGYLTSWEGTNGVGQVESLFVQPEFRHRGLATALLAHGVRDCRTRGVGPVVIATDAADTPKHMYATLGWRPVAVKRNYLKIRPDAGSHHNPSQPVPSR